MKRIGHLKRILFSLLFIASAIALYVQKEDAVSVFSFTRIPNAVLIIDAGHGGEDGGAVSPNGLIESHINLEIALRVGALMDLYGVNHKLLRESDKSLHDNGCNTIREKKISDLRNRVKMIESTPNAILLSIHQNTFSNSRYHGAQVFYGSIEKSLPFAQRVQGILKTAIDPDNSRVPTAIPSSVYLMNHITCPAILVECGFLSNPQEEVQLNTPEYQLKLALALSSAYLTYQDELTTEEFPL